MRGGELLMYAPLFARFCPGYGRATSTATQTVATFVDAATPTGSANPICHLLGQRLRRMSPPVIQRVKRRALAGDRVNIRAVICPFDLDDAVSSETTELPASARIARVMPAAVESAVGTTRSTTPRH